MVFAVALLLLAQALASAPAAAEPVLVARHGQALQPVVISAKASERVRTAAADLADMLSRISGGDFTLTTGDGVSGIAVGLPADFPALGPCPELTVNGLADREKYRLQSHPQGLSVLGATELAVEDAVWDLLYRLGVRQFFPGKTWEVVPSSPDLQVNLDEVQQPDWLARRIWYGYGTWDYNAQPYAEWCVRNRVRQGFQLNTGHAYEAIIRANRPAFDAHPEFLGLLGGERKSSKLCIGNPALRKLVVAYALRFFEENPEADCLSMEPSDGGGWCECADCAALGSITDRALTLANEVAAAVAQVWPDKCVGLYAYNNHSPPPTLEAHPNVVVSLATAFIKGGLTFDQVLSGWSQKAHRLGIREYYSVNTWDRDQPGKARGANLAYLAETIPKFHARGARFLSAESSDNWGPNGLGYYVASRLLWDTDDAQRVDELVDDFLTRAFGPATPPMTEVYRLLDGANKWLVFDDLLGRLYRALGEASRLADTPEVQGRVESLILYARYVELFHQYSVARGAARQQAFEALIRHAYRMRQTMMVHTKALYRDLVNRDRTVSLPPDCAWNVPEGKNPWKSSEPFSQAEFARFVAQGIATHPLVELGFAPVTFGDELVPATPLHLPEVQPGIVPPGRGTQTFYTWVAEAPSVLELEVTGGLIAHYRDRGNVRIELHRLSSTGEAETRAMLVAQDDSVPPDGQPHTVRLEVKQTGLHRLTVNDGNDKTRIGWRPGTPMTIQSSLETPAHLGSRFDLYFYVPKGTEVLGLFAAGPGDLRDADNNVRRTFDDKEGAYYALPVPPGQDGRLWQFHHTAGDRRLLTVPPYLARSAAELLLPREVVEKDR